MEYRDDRDALRQELESLRASEARAVTRADRAEAELARARQSLTDLEAELRSLRPRTSPAPSATPTSDTRRIARGVAILALCGGAAFVALRGGGPRPGAVAPAGTPEPPNAVPPASEPLTPEPPAASEPVHVPTPPVVDAKGVVHLPNLGEAGVVASIVHLAGQRRDDILGVHTVGELLFLAAVEGDTFATVWHAGPFGREKGSDGYVHVVTVDDRVFVSDADAKGAIFALKSGRRIFDVTLPNRFRRACAIAGRTAVWAMTDDGAEMEIDLLHGTAKPLSDIVTCRLEANAHAPTLGEESSSEIRGDTRVLFTVGDGDDSIAIGTRKRGRPVLMVVGGESNGGWSTLFPEAKEELSPADLLAADMASGRVYLSYPSETGAAVSALDVKTGAHAWTTALDAGAAVLRATPRRVFLLGRRVDVLDAETGKLLATSRH